MKPIKFDEFIREEPYQNKAVEHLETRVNKERMQFTPAQRPVHLCVISSRFDGRKMIQLFYGEGYGSAGSVWTISMIPEIYASLSLNSYRSIFASCFVFALNADVLRVSVTLAAHMLS